MKLQTNKQITARDETIELEIDIKIEDTTLQDFEYLTQNEN